MTKAKESGGFPEAVVVFEGRQWSLQRTEGVGKRNRDTSPVVP